jgi:hypothetical protein
VVVGCFDQASHALVCAMGWTVEGKLLKVLDRDDLALVLDCNSRLWSSASRAGDPIQMVGH